MKNYMIKSYVEVLGPIKQVPLFFRSIEASKFERKKKILTDGKPLVHTHELRTCSIADLSLLIFFFVTQQG